MVGSLSHYYLSNSADITLQLFRSSSTPPATLSVKERARYHSLVDSSDGIPRAQDSAIIVTFEFKQLTRNRDVLCSPVLTLLFSDQDETVRCADGH